MSPEPEETRCGHVAVIGRPNVGKSTLINAVVGRKVSIMAPRPQTTRHRILGIRTAPGVQTLYVDTPGLHLAGKRAINRYLNETARRAVTDVDVVVLVVEALRWTEEDDFVLEVARAGGNPVILAVNKVDAVKDKQALLPFLDEASRRHPFHEIVPLSARSGTNLKAFEAAVAAALPPSPFLFPEDQVTDRDARFLVAEVIREKLTLRLGQEVPHALTVEIEQFEEDDGLLRARAIIWVERRGQKKIVVGREGQVLKEVGTRARRELEVLLGRRVHLDLWVKIREDWSDDEQALRRMGYHE